LTQWQAEVGDHGIDDVFDPAQAAILQGWDYPPIQRALRDEITHLGAWEDEAPWYADELLVPGITAAAANRGLSRGLAI
jgi:hypothetical protein